MFRSTFTALFLFFSTIVLATSNDTIFTTREFIDRTGRNIFRQIKDVNKIDTAYIEPEHYNFTAMVQNTNTFEYYRLRSKDGVSITLAPRPTVKVGPYFGWRWIFAGYTFDIGHLTTNNRQEFDLSIYSSKIGIDLFYRKTGENFKIRSLDIDDYNTAPLEDVTFSGMDVKMRGFNVYYIFNHRKFSYPAAFSQSTRQKRSCGSFLAGIGYSRHRIEMDYNALNTLITNKLAIDDEKLDSLLMFDNVSYTDFSVSGGYAYNFVLAKNLLFAASLSVALGYKYSTGNVVKEEKSLLDFAYNNFVIDGVGRFGVVWNNDRFFAGSSFVIHSYNTHKPQFSMNNLFGNLNIYAGWKFGLRKKKDKL